MESRVFMSYSLSKPGAIEDYPFGPEVVVIKLFSKMFALMSRRDGQSCLSLKCDPDYAEILRKQYSSITPGNYLNKRHWNTIALDGSISDQEINRLIDHSYDLVYKSLPKKLQQDIMRD